MRKANHRAYQDRCSSQVFHSQRNMIGFYAALGRVLSILKVRSVQDENRQCDMADFGGAFIFLLGLHSAFVLGACLIYLFGSC